MTAATKRIGALLIELPKPNVQILSSASIRKYDSEVTLYVRGFLTESERPKDYEAWTKAHHKLAASNTHSWANLAIGYNWRSGNPRLNYLVPWMALYWFGTQLQFAFPSPAMALSFIAVDAGIHAAKLASHYHWATQRSELFASELAAELLRLRKNYTRFRVVSHSLGCRHVMMALRELPADQRPDVVHLCAPAFRESEFNKGLLKEGCARERTYLYYTPRDRTLAFVFRYLLRGKGVGGVREPAMGEIGCLDKSYKGLEEIEAGQFFGARVHTEYAFHFHKMAGFL